MSEHEDLDACPSGLVGYGRPPIEHQFKKGQSGNPAGRPRRPKAHPGTAALVLREARRKVTGREGDGTTYSLTVVEVILRQLGISAMKGDVRASREFLKLLEAAQGQGDGDEMTEIVVRYIDPKDGGPFD
jgi:hypothetical protein